MLLQPDGFLGLQQASKLASTKGLPEQAEYNICSGICYFPLAPVCAALFFCTRVLYCFVIVVFIKLLLMKQGPRAHHLLSKKKFVQE